MSSTRLVALLALLLGSALFAQQPNQPSASTPPSQAQIDRWVAELGHDDFAVRQQASARLAEVVDEAEPRPLRLASHSADAEVAHRAKELLERLIPLTLKGHSDWVTSISYSPDGKQIASAGLDGTVKLWNTQTGQFLSSLRGHAGGVLGVSFGPDGKQIASASKDQTVKVWDARTGKEVLSCKGHSGWVTDVSFSPDGKQIASASADNTVRVWDARTGKESLCLHGHSAAVPPATAWPASVGTRW